MPKIKTEPELYPLEAENFRSLQLNMGWVNFLVIFFISNFSHFTLVMLSDSLKIIFT